MEQYFSDSAQKMKYQPSSELSQAWSCLSIRLSCETVCLPFESCLDTVLGLAMSKPYCLDY